jgi:hydroxyethylthiazole kinase
MKEQIWNNILAVREKSPLVHNITNYVVMNNTANALLAVGASPVMAHAHPEIKSMTAISGSLLINIGTLDEYWVESMFLAIHEANAHGKPWVLDPVGAGATPYRDEVLAELIKLRPKVIRGNASEIMALSKYSTRVTKGVDTSHQSIEAVKAAELLNQELGSVVCISGATDIIVDKEQKVYLSNGHPMMGRVTGLGCTASALIAAFTAVEPAQILASTVSAMALLGVAGEIAGKNAAGPGSLQMLLTDKLYNITEVEFQQSLKIVITS